MLPIPIKLKDSYLYDGIVFFDAEYTCWEDSIRTNWGDKLRPPEVIQIGLAYFDFKSKSFNSNFSKYIKPKVNPILSSYCKKLLNINQKLIDESQVFGDVIIEFQKWLFVIEKKCFLCSWGLEDYIYFDTDCKRNCVRNPLSNFPYLDLMRVSSEIVHLGRKEICERQEIKKELNISKSFHIHDALSDAIDLYNIYEGVSKISLV